MAAQRGNYFFLDKFHYADGENAAEMGGSGGGLGDNNAGNPWRRHPTRDITMSQAGTNLHVDYNNWASALSWRPRIVDPDGTLGNNQPFCLSCHRAHGSGGANRHSNLLFGDPLTCTGSCTSYSGGNGTMMRDTCQQCHNQ